MASNSPWILKAPREPARRQGAKIRLFCLPQAGSGAWMYHEWQAGLPNDVEVGRGLPLMHAALLLCQGRPQSLDCSSQTCGHV